MRQSLPPLHQLPARGGRPRRGVVHGSSSWFNGVTALSTEAVKASSQRKGEATTGQIQLHGSTSLSAESATLLAGTYGHKWDGRLPGLKTIPDDPPRTLRQSGIEVGVACVAPLARYTNLDTALGKRQVESSPLP